MVRAGSTLRIRMRCFSVRVSAAGACPDGSRRRNAESFGAKDLTEVVSAAGFEPATYALKALWASLQQMTTGCKSVFVVVGLCRDSRCTTPCSAALGSFETPLPFVFCSAIQMQYELRTISGKSENQRVA